ncbi:MAG: hypothetical protein FWD37_02570 [Methanomassiliicoccaceae archaeon]|nr:hypothetical protein [Methanomassiliicoccaceae archaeon]
MATSSFEEAMVIDTPEAARNLEAAYWEAEIRGPLELPDIDIDKILEEGRKYLRDNPGCLDRLVDAIRKRAEENGEDISNSTKE